MKLNYLKVQTTAFVWLFGTTLAFAQQLADQSEISLNDLSSFKNPGKTWSVVGRVAANLYEINTLSLSRGTGILVNLPTKKETGSDLITLAEHGDIILELDYLMAKGANSGIYLQGRYEVQLEDSWAIKKPLASNNGGIYERWDDLRPEGQKGYGGYAPRQNATKAPGLWQHIKIAFQAPKFNTAGNKIANARILMVELNGVIIHDNVELFGPTRGANSAEKALGALRLQGDHGAVAFKNIKTSKLSDLPKRTGSDADPIFIDAPVNTMIRSFIDISGGYRVVHAISVGSPEQVHFSYDLDNGSLFHAWRGDFIDATPMWHDRGNGSSRPRGSVTTFVKKPVPTLAKLSSTADTWPVDSTGTGFKTKGYIMDGEDRPTFTYSLQGRTVLDAIKALDNGEGLKREISIDMPVENLYVQVAEADSIEEIAKGLYLVDGQSYYLKFDESKDKPVIREVNGKKQMIALLRGKLSYAILF